MSWQDDAACAGHDPDLWFALNGWQVEHAKRVCGRCQVKASCLQEGMSEAAGIWGGLTEGERFELIHGRPRAPRDRTERRYRLRLAE